MAKDETKETLLQTLTKDRLGGLPARRTDEREPEPREPVEPSRETETGRRPEEVVEGRETRPAPSEKPKALAKWKVRVDDGSGEPVTQELTLEQLSERGLLDKLITTANQFPTVQKKYTELLERSAGKEPTKLAETQPAKPTPEQEWEQYRQHTLKVIEAYRPLAERIIEFLVKAGKLEADAPEAYREMLVSFVADSAWKNDRIGALEEQVTQLIDWVKAEVGKRSAERVKGLLDGAIEVIAAKGDGDKGDPLFKDLRKHEVRDAFEQWLRTEVDPKLGSLTPENMEKFWFAYNSQTILDFTKETARKAAEPPPSKRRAASDGSSTRQGGPTLPAQEKTLLDRMSETRLGPEA